MEKRRELVPPGHVPTPPPPRKENLEAASSSKIEIEPDDIEKAMQATIEELRALNQEFREFMAESTADMAANISEGNGGKAKKKSGKKRSERFDRELYELYDIEKMLQEEGKSNGERRYKVLVAEALLFIELSLRDIGLALFILLGFVIGKFLSGLF